MKLPQRGDSNGTNQMYFDAKIIATAINSIHHSLQYKHSKILNTLVVYTVFFFFCFFLFLLNFEFPAFVSQNTWWNDKKCRP